MIAVDTNVLVYAIHSESVHHARARPALMALIDSRQPWSIPWPCVHEFLNIMTNPSVFDRHLTMPEAIAIIEELTASGQARPLGESRQHLRTLRDLTANIQGSKVHDARIAAICLDHGVRELWTADRDFGYFPTLTTRNPLAG